MIRQLLYRSGQLCELSTVEMQDLLLQTRAYNDAHGITGMLLYRDGLFMQLLEGAPDVVDALYARIVADTRHCEVRLLSRGTRQARLLPAWSMGYAEAPLDDGDAPTFDGLADDTDALVVLERAGASDSLAMTMRRFMAGAPVPPGGLVCAARWQPA